MGLDRIEKARLRVDELEDADVIVLFSEIGNRCLNGEQVFNDIYEIFEDYSIEDMQQLLYDSIYDKKLNTSDNYFVVDMNYITSFKDLEYCREMIKKHMNTDQALDILYMTSFNEYKKAYEFIEYLTDNQIINVCNKVYDNILIVPNTPKAIHTLECEYNLNSENIYTTLINDATYDRKDMYIVFYKDDETINSIPQNTIGDSFMEKLIEDMNEEIANEIIKEYKQSEDYVRF